MGRALRDLARVRAADLPRPVHHGRRPERVRGSLRRPRVQGRADHEHRAKRPRALRARRRRREVGARQRGLAPRQHLHAVAGEGGRVLRRDRSRGPRPDRVGRHARGLRGARRRDPPPRRRHVGVPLALLQPGSSGLHAVEAERGGRLRPVRLPRHGAVAASAREGASRDRAAEPLHRPARVRHRRHGPRRVRALPRRAQRMGLPATARSTSTSGRSGTRSCGTTAG